MYQRLFAPVNALDTHMTIYSKIYHRIIFEADTPAGKWFNIILIVSIMLSVIAVMLDSVSVIRAAHGDLLNLAEWFFTILFTTEYLLRLVCVGRPVLYAASFFGIVDLVAIAPTYLSLLFPGSHYHLLAIRLLRVLRIFRVLKLVQYLGEANLLIQVLRSSRRKITVFLFTILTLVVILGSLMYVIEDEQDGFTSIPKSIYWAIVTLTTVGYGDISPKTNIGQALAAVVMLLGYSMIVIPAGIVTAEFTQALTRQNITFRVCAECSAEGHDSDAVYCKQCGTKL